MCLHSVRVPVWVPITWIQNQLEVQEETGYFPDVPKKKAADANNNKNKNRNGDEDEEYEDDEDEIEEENESRRNFSRNAISRKFKTA